MCLAVINAFPNLYYLAFCKCLFLYSRPNIIFTELVWNFFKKTPHKCQKLAIYLNQNFLVAFSMKTFFSRKALTCLQCGSWSKEERDCYPGLWEAESADTGCAPSGRAGSPS